MKRKSLFHYSASFLKWHALIYIVFTIVLWWSVAATFDYPGNAGVPFAAYKDLIMNRIGVTISWGLFFILHFAFHQIRAWSQDREMQIHLDDVTALQERYLSGRRLDLDAQEDESTFDSDMQAEEYRDTKQLASK